MKSTNTTQINIKLLPLLKLSTATGIAIGWVLGILSLIASLFGGAAAANIFGLQFRGTAAGFINVVWVPVMLSVIFGLLTAAAYWPFVWVLRLMGGFRLELQTDESNRAGRASELRSEELVSR